MYKVSEAMQIPKYASALRVMQHSIQNLQILLYIKLLLRLDFIQYKFCVNNYYSVHILLPCPSIYGFKTPANV